MRFLVRTITDLFDHSARHLIRDSDRRNVEPDRKFHFRSFLGCFARFRSASLRSSCCWPLTRSSAIRSKASSTRSRSESCLRRAAMALLRSTWFSDRARGCGRLSSGRRADSFLRLCQGREETQRPERRSPIVDVRRIDCEPSVAGPHNMTQMPITVRECADVSGITPGCRFRRLCSVHVIPASPIHVHAQNWGHFSHPGAGTRRGQLRTVRNRGVEAVRGIGAKNPGTFSDEAEAISVHWNKYDSAHCVNKPKPSPPIRVPESLPGAE